MPRIRLTKSAIDDLPVLAKDTLYWDAGLPGFGVKVTPKGRKVFLVMYRVAGAGSRLRKYTIGPHGRVTLPMARAHAQKIFAARLDGRDPAEEKKQSRRRLVVDRIDDLVETFIQERVSQTRTARRITNLLRRDVIAHWGTKSVHEIKKRDVIDLVTEISQRNAHAAYRLLKTLKTFFRWCVGRAVIDFFTRRGRPIELAGRQPGSSSNGPGACYGHPRRPTDALALRGNCGVPGPDWAAAGGGRPAQME